MRFEAEEDINFQLDLLLNQGLEFNDNIKGAILETDLVLGENTIRHGLGFVPIGYIVFYPGTIAGTTGTSTGFRIEKRDVDDFLLFLPGGAEEKFTGVKVSEWTTEILFLNASVASQGVRLFVL